MTAIRTSHCHSLIAAIVTVVLGVPIASSACSPPPPPTDYDARLSMVVTPDQPGVMGVGATGRIDLTVELLPTPAVLGVPLQIRTLGLTDASQLLPPGALQPIRLTAAPGNTCALYEQLFAPQLGTTYVYTFDAGLNLQLPNRQCSLRIEVLPAASQLRSLKFEAATGSNPSGCMPYRDVNPADNTAAFAYGGAAATQVVPMGGRIGWWVMTIALAAMAMVGVSARRRKSRLN